MHRTPAVESLETRRLLTGSGAPLDPIVLAALPANDTSVMQRQVGRDSDGNLFLDDAPPRVLKFSVAAGALSVRLAARNATFDDTTGRTDLQPVTCKFQLFLDSNGDGKLNLADKEQTGFVRNLANGSSVTVSGSLAAGVYLAQFKAQGGDTTNPGSINNGTISVNTTATITEDAAFSFAPTGGAADTTPPSAKLTLPTPTLGQTAYTFDVAYADATAVKRSTLDGNDIKVTGPGGFSQLAKFVSATAAADAPTLTAHYSVTPPGGSFDPADNGAYTFTLQASQVADTRGNLVKLATLGTLSVNLPFARLDSAGNLTVTGTAAADVIDLSLSGANVTAKLGAKSLWFPVASIKKITVNAGDGNDSVNLHTVNKPSVINGGNGNDNLIGGAGDDSFDGGAGADLVDGGAGGSNDDVHYFSRSEALTVTLDDLPNDGSATDAASSGSATRDNVKSNVEVIQGGGGNDRLVGSRFNNALAGNGGNDTVVGNDGNDLLLGGDGNDLLDGGNGADVFAGGNGVDTADYSKRTDALNISLDLPASGTQRVGNDGAAADGPAGSRDNVRDDVENVTGGKGNDVITGSKFSNKLIGGDGNDSLTGNDANDSLDGGNGNDVLRGGNGDDTLTGGAGVDQLFGDAGNDTFFAKDNTADSLEGGLGTDTATRDSIDKRPKNDIEKLLS